LIDNKKCTLRPGQLIKYFSIRLIFAQSTSIIQTLMLRALHAHLAVQSVVKTGVWVH
jgi:hypothetical protein